MPHGMLGELLTDEQVAQMLKEGWTLCPDCGELYWIPRKGKHLPCQERPSK